MTIKAQIKPCPTCKGKGWKGAVKPQPADRGWVIPKACPSCHGTGREGKG